MAVCLHVLPVKFRLQAQSYENKHVNMTYAADDRVFCPYSRRLEIGLGHFACNLPCEYALKWWESYDTRIRPISYDNSMQYSS